MENEFYDFNTKLKELREIHGYTQQQIAKYLHIDKTTYAHYEAGRRLPNVEKVRKLAELYGLHDELLNEIFPVEVTIKYPKSMLDKAEKCLKEVNDEQVLTHDQLNRYLDKLWKTFEPIFKIRQEALKLPEAEEDYLMPGQNKTIKKVYLDVRGERFINAYVELQKKIYNDMKK